MSRSEPSKVGGRAPGAVLLLPRSGCQVRAKSGDRTLLGAGIHEAPPRLRPPYGVVEESLRAGVVGLAESVHAVDRHRHGAHRTGAAQGRADRVQGREASAFGCEELGGVVREPEAVQRIPVEGQHHDRSAGDAPQLAQALLRVRPLMDGERGHRRVDGVVVEGKILGDGIDGGDTFLGAL